MDYTIAELFREFPMLNARAFARAVGINASLMQNYKGENAPASTARKAEIESALHALADQLKDAHII